MQSPPPKADPAIYPMLRQNALSMGVRANAAPGTLVAVLMDQLLANGSMSVLAAADGSASIYLSSGGGFIGGGQQYPAIRTAAEHALDIARTARTHFRPTTNTGLPPAGTVRFFLITNGPAQSADATEADLRTHNSPLLDLANAMQAVVTQYRLTQQKPAT